MNINLIAFNFAVVKEVREINESSLTANMLMRIQSLEWARHRKLVNRVSMEMLNIQVEFNKLGLDFDKILAQSQGI